MGKRSKQLKRANKRLKMVEAIKAEKDRFVNKWGNPCEMAMYDEIGVVIMCEMPDKHPGMHTCIRTVGNDIIEYFWESKDGFIDCGDVAIMTE